MTQETIKELKKILRFPESTEGKNLIRKILHLKLPPDMLDLVKKYELAGGKRNIYLWKWCWYTQNAGFILSCVSPEYFEIISKIRLALTIFITALDDIADIYRDRKFIDELVKIPFYLEEINYGKMDKKQKIYTKFIAELWKKIDNLLQKLPRYDEFRDMLLCDLRQSYDSLYYSYLVNTYPSIINLEEVKARESSNMIWYVYSDAELMASPSFDIKELGLLREIISYSQQMVRLGNWLGTWKREIKERDFSSAVVAYGLNSNIITVEDLLTQDSDYLIKKLENSNAQECLLREWMLNYKKIEKLAPLVKSVDIIAYLKGLKNLLKLQLICSA